MRWNAWCCYALEDGERKSRFLVLYVIEEGSEMECLVLLCAERQREAWRQRDRLVLIWGGMASGKGKTERIVQLRWKMEDGREGEGIYMHYALCVKMAEGN